MGVIDNLKTAKKLVEQTHVASLAREYINDRKMEQHVWDEHVKQVQQQEAEDALELAEMNRASREERKDFVRRSILEAREVMVKCPYPDLLVERPKPYSLTSKISILVYNIRKPRTMGVGDFALNKDENKLADLKNPYTMDMALHDKIYKRHHLLIKEVLVAYLETFGAEDVVVKKAVEKYANHISYPNPLDEIESKKIKSKSSTPKASKTKATQSNKTIYIALALSIAFWILLILLI